jgi:hypothetical protein
LVKKDCKRKKTKRVLSKGKKENFDPISVAKQEQGKMGINAKLRAASNTNLLRKLK